MILLQRLHKLLAPPADPTIVALYNACVAQARQPEFYRAFGVPDTIDGRFDLLLLHAFLVMRRLGDEAEAKQALFDLMFADMDRSLREMGVGDMSVGKKMRPMIAAFYGRAKAYDNGLAGDDGALAEALRRNLYGKTAAEPEKTGLLTAYVRRAAEALDRQPLATIFAGKPLFPVITG
jgi:cytochrome b pre-mRNA-processing protein 3